MIKVIEVDPADVDALDRLPTWMLRGFAERGSLPAKAALARRGKRRAA